MLRHARSALAAAFIALAVALGFLLAAVPNVELVTLTVCVAGGVLGPRIGAFVGAATACLHSLLNPLGPPPFPLLFVGQVVGLALAGTAGGLWLARASAGSLRRATFSFALLGAGSTLTYQVLTNVGIGIHSGKMWETLVGGLSFSFMHLVWNTIIFAVLGPRAAVMLRDMGHI